MAKFVADWILGVTLKKLIYTVENADGTPFDLTGYTCTLLGRRQSDAPGSVPISIVHSGTPSTDGKATFASPGGVAGLTLNSERDAFECRVKIVKATDIGYTEPFEIGVRAWP